MQFQCFHPSKVVREKFWPQNFISSSASNPTWGQSKISTATPGLRSTRNTVSVQVMVESTQGRAGSTGHVQKWPRKVGRGIREQRNSLTNFLCCHRPQDDSTALLLILTSWKCLIFSSSWIFRINLNVLNIALKYYLSLLSFLVPL